MPRSRVVRLTVATLAVVFVGWQLTTPLSFYLGDRLDERFAWRMNSVDRLTRCTAWIDERRS